MRSRRRSSLWSKMISERSEADEDRFRPMSSHNRAPLLTVGDLRRLAALAAKSAGGGDVG